jgi:hypothetical protein
MRAGVIISPRGQMPAVGIQFAEPIGLQAKPESETAGGGAA